MLSSIRGPLLYVRVENRRPRKNAAVSRATRRMGIQASFNPEASWRHERGSPGSTHGQSQGSPAAKSVRRGYGGYTATPPLKEIHRPLHCGCRSRADSESSALTSCPGRRSMLRGPVPSGIEERLRVTFALHVDEEIHASADASGMLWHQTVII